MKKSTTDFTLSIKSKKTKESKQSKKNLRKRLPPAHLLPQESLKQETDSTSQTTAKVQKDLIGFTIRGKNIEM